MNSSLEEQNNIYYNIITSMREQHVSRASLVGEQYSGPCGKSCMDWTLWKVVYGLRIQQPSLVDANEFTLLSVLTRDRMMMSFLKFLGLVFSQ